MMYIIIGWLLLICTTVNCIISPLSPYKANQISVCSKIPVFLQTNTQLCRAFQRLIGYAIINATVLSNTECQRQFKHRRWNCSNDAQSLTRLITQGFPETAFLYAIHSAGLAYSIAAECKRGGLPGCNCEGRKKRRLTKTTIQHENGNEQKTFEWSDPCMTDSINYGISLSKRLMNSNEAGRDMKAIIDRHNKEAGRKAIISLGIGKQLECRCHGISGACAVRTCWRRLPNFSEIGHYLRRKYDSAIKVMVDNKGEELIPVNPTIKKPRSKDLVYSTDSPDFCVADKSIGSLGTNRRKCVIDKLSLNSCSILCCNRGHTEMIIEHTVKCNCRFHNCCRVMCETCKANVTESYCK